MASRQPYPTLGELVIAAIVCALWVLHDWLRALLSPSVPSMEASW